MSTFSNTAREVEMPNGDVVVIHKAPTGGANTTSNIKKFKYDDNGHVTESEAANATDLNLNSYSTPTTGSTAIGTSDAVQTAIGKLDHQSQIDQSNILYVSEHNANRNLLLNTASTTTIDGVTFTVNADKSVTITGSQNNPSQHTKLVLGKFTANRSDLVLDSGIAASASANIFINTQDGVTTTRNLGHATITGTDLNTERDYQILVIAGTSNINTTIKPMICTQADWDATQEYEASGGLPNYDLTRLEAEDRAGLIECVDGGAKNLLNFDITSLKALNTGGTWSGNSYTYKGVTFTYNDSTKTISTYGTSTSGNVIFYLMNFTPTSGKSFTISGCPSGGSATGYRFCNMGQAWVNDYGSSGTAVGDGTSKEMAIYIQNSGTTVGTSSNPLTWKLMICTKAAFCVSNKFVPYRPNWDLVCDSVIDLNDMISSFTVNSSKSVSIKLRRDGSFTMLMFGFVQTIGKVHWYIESNTSTSVSVIDAMTGSAVSQSVISFAYSESTAILTISANVYGNCNFVLIRSAY